MSNWDEGFELLGLDPTLLDPPDQHASPPVQPRPALLPFHEAGWAHFERVCVAVATEIDGLHGVEQYGIPGQRQDGLDLVGWDAEGNAVVYSAKDYKEFTPTDLHGAVEAYATGPRPFGARRLAVCVGAEVAWRTEVVQELARLRAVHPDLTIDLYHRRRLSDMLSGRPDLVAKFFGTAWRDAFCESEPAPSFGVAGQRSPLRADALLRGPVRHLELEARLQAAEAAATTAPGRAAAILVQVAARLERAGYPAHALPFRRRQGELLRQAGQHQDAADVFFELAWEGILTGSQAVAPAATRALEELAASAPDGVVVRPRAAAVAAATRWFADFTNDLSGLATATRALADAADRYAPPVMLWLAETALVMERPDVVTAFTADLEATIARHQPIVGPAAEELTVRLRLCLAEVRNDWDALVRAATSGRLRPRQAMLILARRGRDLAWRAQPDQAEDFYRRAVDRACQAELPAEAAAYLHAIWKLGTLYDPPSPDWDEVPRLAEAVAATGTAAYLPAAFDPRAGALDALREGKLPAAHRHLRRYLRNSRITGRFEDELEAHQLLGDLNSRSGEAGLAALGYIRAGSAKLLQALLGGLDAYLDCSDQLRRVTPWERACALRAAAVQGDLVPDAAIPNLVTVALANTDGMRQGPFGPQVGAASYALLGAVAARIPDQHVDQLLGLLAPQVRRGPNQYRHNDDDHVAILLGLFTAHEHRSSTLADRLLDLMTASPELGQQLLKQGGEVLESGRDALLPGLRRLADQGNREALHALFALDEPHPLLLRQARERLETELSRQPDPPGTWSYSGTLPQSASLATLLPAEDQATLARHAIALAASTSNTELDRSDALRALGILARTLPAELRDDLVSQVLTIAQTEGSDNAFDAMLRGSLHPLSPHRFDLGVGRLAPEAVRAAAALAQRADQIQAVTDAAMWLLRRGDENAVHHAAHALAALPPDQLQLDPRLLAASPSPWLRQLAAVTWVRRPEPAPELGLTLAHDSDAGVRRALASGLARLRERDAALATELGRRLGHDQCFSVRLRASRALRLEQATDES
jgi:tetratricopeptide (TPR) repeat protein